MRFVIHLKPVQKEVSAKALLGHLNIVKYLRGKNLKTTLHPEKRMIKFEAKNPGIVAHIKKQFGDQIECVLSDSHGAGLYRRPSQHVTPAGRLSPSAQLLTPMQVAKAYNFPAPGPSIKDKVVAIIELGGGYKSFDVMTYCHQMGVKYPRLFFHSIDGGTNTQDNPDGADGEVSLDIDVVASVASGLKILTVFAPNTTNGFIDAVANLSTYFLKPDAVSISWGSPERYWDPGAIKAMDNAIEDCVANGIQVFVASGDNGSSDGTAGNNVDFPASSPNAIACGGTKLILNANGTRNSEVVWNEQLTGEGAGGGGLSVNEPVDPLQSALQPQIKLTGRAVPDIAGNADPNSGYIVDVDGQRMAIGGTSAVAPLMAALTALVASNLSKPIGDLRSILYTNTGIFFDVTSGNNGAFKATTGFDCASGLGVPDGSKLLNVLKKREGLLHKILRIVKRHIK